MSPPLLAPCLEPSGSSASAETPSPRPAESAGMFQTTQWVQGPAASSLSRMRASEAVPSGTSVHSRGGEISSPVLPGATVTPSGGGRSLAQVCLTGMRRFSLKTGLVNVMVAAISCWTEASPPASEAGASGAAAGAGDSSPSLEQAKNKTASDATASWTMTRWKTFIDYSCSKAPARREP